MAKEKVGEMKGEGGQKFVFEKGENYKFKAMDFRVIDGSKVASGAPLVIVDAMCIGTSAYVDVFGKHTELSFSMSPNAKSFAAAWLLALGFSEEDEVETEDSAELEAQLRRSAKGSIFMCNLEKEKRGGYDQNKVTPPWEVHSAEASDDDYKVGDETGAF